VTPEQMDGRTVQKHNVLSVNDRTGHKKSNQYIFNSTSKQTTQYFRNNIVQSPQLYKFLSDYGTFANT
jgi:hypothetical protein